MPTCETCGNSYDQTFNVVKNGTTYTFDSFECAIHKLAPRCAHCDTPIVGHGVEARGIVFCCANCARADGAPGPRDRV